MGVPGAVSVRAVFLDRDGVVNRAMVRSGKPHPPDSLQQLEILPEVPSSLAALKQRGYLLLVVTNQPDVARGRIPRQSVDAIHDYLKNRLPLDAILACFHDDADRCDCRKPKPGLLLRAARDFGVDLQASFMIGDRRRDIEAGMRAGCRTVFVDREYDEERPTAYNHRAASLADACAIILGS
jgi:D-glycero-D-manno-heptose 1,7-bisphosphate phosphatase